MMKELVSKSRNKIIVEQLTTRKGAKKGPEYNASLIPFIQKYWNIEEAVKNSYSLGKAVKRISEFSPTQAQDSKKTKAENSSDQIKLNDKKNIRK